MARSQPVHVACEGGLILGTNKFDSLEMPGAARVLTNFEIPLRGGYRRINGYTRFGGENASSPVSDSIILGVYPYAEGAVVVAEDGIYYSETGEFWLQVNKDIAETGVEESELASAPELTRSGQAQAQFVIGKGLEDAVNNPNGVIHIATGNNPLAVFEIEGTGLNKTYYYEEVSTGFSTPQWVTDVAGHLVVVDEANFPSTVFYSAIFSYTNFSDTGSGSIDFPGRIVGVKAFRENLYVFCEDSIHRVINMNDPESISVEDVTNNMGCVNGHSIQEIGGDLIFLAKDGLRTLSATERIGDLNLAQIGKGVQPVLVDIIDNINTYTVSSCVISPKNQYRLFYNDGVSFRGVCGTLLPTSQGGANFYWSQLEGFDCNVVGSGIDRGGIERVYQGGITSNIYLHDEGDSFNGEDIMATWTAPDVHYGDAGSRKTLLYINLSFENEGATQITVQPTFDFQDSQVPQPGSFILGDVATPAFFGSAVFGIDVFGAVSSPLARNSLVGSGHTVSFTFTSTDSNAPYIIHGYHIEIIPSGRK